MPASVPGVLARRPGTQLRKVRPTERRRRDRTLAVRFSPDNADVPDRLRAVAVARRMIANNGAPNISGLVEEWLLPCLEAAELKLALWKGDAVESDDEPVSPWAR